MGLGEDAEKLESWDVGKSKSSSRKKKKECAKEETTGCWVRLRFVGSCFSSRSKVDSSVSGISTHCGNPLLFLLELFYIVLEPSFCCFHEVSNLKVV